MVLFSPFASFEVSKINQIPKKSRAQLTFPKAHAAAQTFHRSFFNSQVFPKQKNINPFRSVSSLPFRALRLEILKRRCFCTWASSTASRGHARPVQLWDCLGWLIDPTVGIASGLMTEDVLYRFKDNTVKYIVVFWYTSKPFSTPKAYAYVGEVWSGWCFQCYVSVASRWY